MRRETTFIVRQIRAVLRGILCGSILATCFCCPFVFAAGFSTFAGGEIDGRGQGFSYMGMDMTQSINKTISFSGRIVPSFLTYKYYSGDRLIKANSPGISPAAGIKLLWGQSMIGFFGGVEFRNTTLNPDDQSASVRGSSVAGTLQGEYDTWFSSRTSLNASASFSGTSNFVYERLRIKQQITNLDFNKMYTLNAGVEQFYGRNSDFHQEGGGLILELFQISWRTSVAVRSGLKRDSTFGSGAYGGLEIYKGF
ncbi:MAG: cellulose biosynthesis protein BcsS [Nitrospirae bacterium]|nr:cellulose biosynthesis protein BcsS [Nitrospirota bacterium]